MLKKPTTASKDKGKAAAPTKGKDAAAKDKDEKKKAAAPTAKAAPVGKTGQAAQDTGPINPQGTASLKADLRQGSYSVNVRDGSLRVLRGRPSQLLDLARRLLVEGAQQIAPAHELTPPCR